MTDHHSVIILNMVLNMVPGRGKARIGVHTESDIEVSYSSSCSARSKQTVCVPFPCLSFVLFQLLDNS